MNILVLLKSTYARLIGMFGVNLNRIYWCVIHIALSKHGLPLLRDVNEAPRQGVPPIWDLHMDGWIDGCQLMSRSTKHWQ